MQLKHVVWYELGFCHIFDRNWAAARAHFANLERDNDWSRAFYAYMQAACALEQGDTEGASELMRRVAAHKSKIKLGGTVLRGAGSVAAVPILITHADLACHNRTTRLSCLLQGRFCRSNSLCIAVQSATARTQSHLSCRAWRLPTSSTDSAK